MGTSLCHRKTPERHERVTGGIPESGDAKKKMYFAKIPFTGF
jgi:hypothetical protein